MVIADIGPATTIVEVAATAVGAGIVLGGFAGSGVGLLRHWPHSEHAARVLSDGYAGGLIGLGAIAFDLIVRYSL